MVFSSHELSIIRDALALAMEERAALAKSFPEEAGEQRVAILEMESLAAQLEAARPPLPRFYVQAYDGNGDSLSWFIDAETEGDAVRLWRRVETVQEMGEGATPRVFILPPAGVRPRALPWHDESGVMESGVKPESVVSIDTGSIMGNASRAESVAPLFAAFLKWATGETLESVHIDDLRDAARDMVTNLGHFMRFHTGMTPEVWGQQVAMAARMAAEEAREDSDAE